MCNNKDSITKQNKNTLFYFYLLKIINIVLSFNDELHEPQGGDNYIYYIFYTNKSN